MSSTSASSPAGAWRTRVATESSGRPAWPSLRRSKGGSFGAGRRWLDVAIEAQVGDQFIQACQWTSRRFAQQAQAPRRRPFAYAARRDQHRLVQFERDVRRDQGAADLGRLNYHRAVAQRGDYAVTTRVRAVRRLDRGVMLADKRATAVDDLPPQIAVGARTRVVVPATNHRDGESASGHCGRVRGTIDAHRRTRNDNRLSFDKPRGDLTRQQAAGGCGPARAHHRSGPWRGEDGRIAEAVNDGRLWIEHVQPPRIAAVEGGQGPQPGFIYLGERLVHRFRQPFDARQRLRTNQRQVIGVLVSVGPAAYVAEPGATDDRSSTSERTHQHPKDLWPDALDGGEGNRRPSLLDSIDAHAALASGEAPD